MFRATTTLTLGRESRWRLAGSRHPRRFGWSRLPRLLALEDRTVPAAFLVTNVNDSGAGSLRQAILDSNAAAGADTIDFDPAAFAGATTITLTSGELTVSGDLTVNGPGADKLTVDANYASRLLTVYNATSALNVSLNGLTLSRGSATRGGAVFLNAEALTLTDCVVTASKATAGGGGGIDTESNSTLSLTGCTVSANTSTANGGGISAGPGGSKVTITDSKVTGNASGASGGALGIGYGSVTVTTSTISGNTAALVGGAFYLWGSGLQFLGSTASGNSAGSQGGAVHFGGTQGTHLFRNSTVSGNQAPNGGGIRLAGNSNDLQMQNSTVTANSAATTGGGISGTGGSGVVSLTSSVVSGNIDQSPGAGYAPDIASDKAVTANYSAVGSAAGFPGLSGANNLAFGADLKLGPLADNGGPTKTHLPQPGSPLIDAGSNAAGLATDQRGPGFPRVLGVAADIGAAEWAGPFVVINANDAGPGSLRQAILAANALAGADTISFDAAAFAGATTITLTTGELLVSDDLTIDGPGADKVTVDANYASRVLNVYNAAQWIGVAVDGMTLTRGSATGGGAVLNQGEALTLTGCAITASKATAGPGGGIRMTSGTTTLVNSTVSGNSSSGNGGGIDGGYAGGAVAVTGSTITGNSSGKNGGGVSIGWEGEAGGLSVTVDNSTVSDNTSTGHGGGFYVREASLQFLNSTASANSGNQGGAFFLSGVSDQLLVRNSTVSGNGAQYGGGIRLLNCDTTLRVENSTVADNSAAFVFPLTFGGGGISRSGGTGEVSIVSSVIARNVAVDPVFGANPSDISSDSTTIIYRHSAIGSASGWAGFDEGGNLPFGTDLKLAPLADNGGPTKTHLPAGDSPLLDSGINPAGLTYDQRGPGFPRALQAGADIGSVEVVGVAPYGVLTPVDTVVTPGPTPNTLTVTYGDDVGIDVSTLGTADIEILGPGVGLTVTGFSVDNPTNGTPRVVTYTFVPPGGAWDALDSGTYTVMLKAGAVADIDPTPHTNPARQLGGFAVVIAQVLNVDEASDVNDGNTTPGHLSLREALGLANASDLTADTITFDPAVFATKQTIVVGSVMAVTGPVVVTGPGADKLVLDGNLATRLFELTTAAGNPVTISGVTLTRGHGSDGGAVAMGAGALTLSKVVLSQNTADNFGGAVACDTNDSFTSVTIVDSVVTGNSAGGYGGAVSMFYATLNVVRSTATGNSAGEAGGFALVAYGSGGFGDSTISNNKAAAGGALFTFAADADLANCIVSGNEAGAGGAMMSQYSVVNATSCTFAQNKATDAAGEGGGAILVSDGSLNVASSTLSGNLSAGPGGAIAALYSGITLANCTLSGNTAALHGGAVAVGKYSYLTAVNCTIAGNTSSNGKGGGLALTEFVEVAILNTIVATNSGAAGPDLWSSAPVTTYGDYNLVGVANLGGVTLGGTHNLTGTAAAPLNPQFDPAGLKDNGGPTHTIALLPTSPAVDAGTTDPAVPATDQRGVPRPAGKAPDIGAYELQAVAPTVVSVKVNGGAVQRSLVTQIEVTFSEAVSFLGGVAAAFTLNRTGPGAPTGSVNLSAVQVGSTVTITFAGGGAVGIDPGGSLVDGVYQLVIDAAKVQGAGGSLDGNGDGTGGDNYQTPAAGAGRIHRLFGDSDGDADVDTTDFGAFRTVFGGTGSTFDFDNDGDVDATDFGQFRVRFGTGV